MKTNTFQHHKRNIEGNGLGRPLVLSVLIHCLILGVIIFTNHIPDMSATGAIEASMMTPEQLAELQEQIIDNQNNAPLGDANAEADSNEAGQANNNAQTAAAVAATAATAKAVQTNTKAAKNSNKATKKSVPLIQPTQEDNPPAAEPEFDNSANEAIKEKKRKFEEERAKIAAELERGIATEKNAKKSAANKKRAEEKQRLEEYKQAEQIDPDDIEDTPADNTHQSIRANAERLAEQTAYNTQPKKSAHEVLANEQTKPVQEEGTATNLDTTRINPAISPLNSRGNQTARLNNGRNFSNNRGVGRPNGGGGQRRVNISMITALIKRHFIPPQGGRNQSTRLTITVNATGRVVRASASGPDDRVNRAAELAALAASPLPIKAGDSLYPRFTVNFKGSY